MNRTAAVGLAAVVSCVLGVVIVRGVLTAPASASPGRFSQANTLYLPSVADQSSSGLLAGTSTPIVFGTPSATSTPYTVQTNIVYCSPNGFDQQADVYTPLVVTSTLPLVIYIHGGGWIGGDKSELGTASFTVPTLDELTSHGYAVASINYRLAPTYPFPAMIEDAKCAVRYFRTFAPQYHVDPNRFAAWGSSAGGHLSNLLGTAGTGAGWDVGQYITQTSQVEAVVDWFGPADLATLYAEAVQSDPPGEAATLIPQTFGTTEPTKLALGSPVHYVAFGDPPFIIQHGVDDTAVYPDQSQEFYSDLFTATVPSQLVWVQNAGHLFAPTPPGAVISPSLTEIAVQVRTFLDANLPASRSGRRR